jgi:hypothetical protein
MSVWKSSTLSEKRLSCPSLIFPLRFLSNCLKVEAAKSMLAHRKVRLAMGLGLHRHTVNVLTLHDAGRQSSV